jgi:hypothetical protein
LGDVELFQLFVLLVLVDAFLLHFQRRSGMAEDVKEIKITREELYEKVWKVPLSQLAKQYQISDVGLAKICSKLNVPRPPRGYWTKLKFGFMQGSKRQPRWFSAIRPGLESP